MDSESSVGIFLLFRDIDLHGHHKESLTDLIPDPSYGMAVSISF